MELDDDDVRMLKRMVRWMKNCQVQGAAYDNTPDGGFVIRIPPPPPRPYIPKPFKLCFGTVQNQYMGSESQPWNPGTNYCTLQPCTDDTGSTAVAGASNVNVYIMHPLGKPACTFGAQVNDVLCYIPWPMVTTTPDGDAPDNAIVGILLGPVIAGTSQQYASALENQSGDDAPNYQPAYQKVHG